ncbi:swr complex subunit [Mortierella sp. GBA30]|nr:swr complex subunit [Mortierella sp. GBA30]
MLMATGNDVREIFQLKPSEQVRRVQKTEKKPGMSFIFPIIQLSSVFLHYSNFIKQKKLQETLIHGISRELYGLIGNNVSTVAFNNPTYKPKLNVSKKAVNWTWRPFMNPSRDDDLILHHWEKTRTDPNEEYRFYKFNKAINLIDFSAEDYNAHLQDSDWTLEETNYLWDLCRRFDLRWVVITDRYEWPPQEQDRLALQYYNGNNTDNVNKVTTDSKSQLEQAEPAESKDSVITQEQQQQQQQQQQPKQEPQQQQQPQQPVPITLAEPDATAAASAAMSTSVAASTVSLSSSAAAATVTVGPIQTNTTETPSTTSSSTELPTTAVTNGDSNSTASTITVTPSATATTISSSAMEIVSYVPPKTRSMEDLKHRYYSVNRILTKVRLTDSSQASEKAQLLSSMAYDKNREIERKKNLEILNKRTPEQIEEEEALYLEARRIDQNEKRITRERENLLRLLNTRDIFGPGGPTSANGLAGQVAGGGGPGTGIIIPSNSITIPSSTSGPSGNNANGPMSPVGKNANGVSSTSTTGSGAAVKKRKKTLKGSVQTEEVGSTMAGSGSSGGVGTSSTKGSVNRRPSTSSTQNDISAATAALMAPLPTPKKEKLTPGAYLRSQKMTPVVSTKQQRVQSTLVQLGLPFKPLMPTATVMAKWDQLQNNIVTLLDLKKQVDKLESDLKVVKMRRGSASGVSLVPGSASAGSGTGVGGAGVGGSDGNFGVKREGTVDESGATGQVKKKKKKE